MGDEQLRFGRVIWRETMTRDVAKSQAFYGALFGWTFEEMDMGPDGKYPIIQCGGKGIGGMMKATPEMAHVPPHWVSYVSVPDVDKSCVAAKDGGGKVVWGPIDIPGVGRMATVVGFDGPVLAVMRPTPQGESPAPGRPAVGEFCWETLTTADVDRAKKYWTRVIGWQTASGGGMPTFGVGAGMENQVADIQPAQGPVPPNWLTYVVVEKLEAANAKVEKLGGKVMMAEIPVPGIGRLSVIADDQGAALGLFEPAMG